VAFWATLYTLNQGRFFNLPNSCTCPQRTRAVFAGCDACYLITAGRPTGVPSYKQILGSSYKPEVTPDDVTFASFESKFVFKSRTSDFRFWDQLRPAKSPHCVVLPLIITVHLRLSLPLRVSVSVCPVVPVSLLRHSCSTQPRQSIGRRSESAISGGGRRRHSSDAFKWTTTTTLLPPPSFQRRSASAFAATNAGRSFAFTHRPACSPAISAAFKDGFPGGPGHQKYHQLDPALLTMLYHSLGSPLWWSSTTWMVLTGTPSHGFQLGGPQRVRNVMPCPSVATPEMSRAVLVGGPSAIVLAYHYRRCSPLITEARVTSATGAWADGLAGRRPHDRRRSRLLGPACISVAQSAEAGLHVRPASTRISIVLLDLCQVIGSITHQQQL